MKTHASFPIKIELESLPIEGKAEAFCLSEEARQAVAERFGVLSVEKFEGQYLIVPIEKYFMVSASYQAKVSQACVVTGEAVKEVLEERFDVKIERKEEPEDLPMDEESLLAEEDTEYVPDGIVDIGDIISQYLATALNPFPRKKGAELKDSGDNKISLVSEEEDKQSRNPFSILKKLQDKG